MGNMAEQDEEFFQNIFKEASVKLPEDTAVGEESRLRKYSLDCQKNGVLEKSVARIYCGYDSENSPSKKPDRANGGFLSMQKAFDSAWNWAQTHTRKRVGIAIARAIYNVDFLKYEKNQSALSLYCEMAERESDSIKVTVSKRIARMKIPGVIQGKTTLSINTMNNIMTKITGRDWAAQADEFGRCYRDALSRKMLLRNERIEVSAIDEEVDYDDYL